MYCPRCGGEVENGAAFCSNCGLDLREKPAADPAAAPPKPRKSRKKAWIIAASALVVVAAAAVGAYFIFSGGGAKLEGKYNSLVAPVNYIEFTPDRGNASHGTYDEEAAGYHSSSKYDIDSENVVTMRDCLGTSGNDKKVDISGKYIIYQYSICEGKIPQGETFEVTCVQREDWKTETYSFKKDGSYTQKVHSIYGDSEHSGTYRRDGDKILMEEHDKNGVILKFTYLIYHNQLATDAYVKQGT